MAAAGSERGRPRDPAAEERILRAAAQLLRRRGVDGLRITAVAKRARVSKATIYRHWSSRDALGYDALARLLDLEEVPIPDIGTVEGDLASACTDTVRFLGTPIGASLLRVVAKEPVDPQASRPHDWHVLERRIYAVQAILKRAIERGEVHPDIDPAVVAEAVVGAIVLRAILLPTPRAGEISCLLEVVLNGLRTG